MIPKYMLFNIIFLSSLYGVDYFDPYWLKLLHYKDGVSEIDDKSFFLSSHGNYLPKEELLATLNSIERGDYSDVNSTQCRFPARTRWLKKQFPNRGIRECKYIKQHLKDLDFKSLYIVFVSSYLNSPASSFGHSFLRFDRDDNPLLSYALNYSAHIDKSINLFAYAFKGVFGGFEGRYSVAPYYEMVKIYSNMERRDIWEYKLKLNREEIARITLHMIEMQRYHSSYYFIYQNCSYNILWFISLAKDNLNLMDEFNYIAVPMDSIKLLERYNLIEDVIFRPSKESKLNYLYKNIENKGLISRFLKDENLSLIEGLRESQRAKIVDLAILNQKPKLETLKYRSRLKVKKDELNITKTNPIKSNLASKLNISISDRDNLSFGGRVSYHDIYDIDYDFNEGKYISFFDVNIESGRLESFDFIKIDSFVPNSGLSSSLSWGLAIGYRDNSFEIVGDVGESYRFLDTLFFLKPSIKLNKKLEFGYRVGLLRSFDRVKFGLISEDGANFRSFITYKIDDNYALHIYNYREENIVTLFYYF